MAKMLPWKLPNFKHKGLMKTKRNLVGTNPFVVEDYCKDCYVRIVNHQPRVI